MLNIRQALLVTACCALLWCAATPAATQDNDEVDKALAKASALARMGDSDQAIAELKKAARLSNDQCPLCLTLMGRIYFQERKYKEAAQVYRQALALKPPDEGELLNSLGVAIYLQGDPKLLPDAADALNKAIQVSGGKVVKAYYNLGHTLLKMGKQEDGIAALKTFLSHEPNSEYASEIQALINNPKLAGERFAFDFKVKSTSGEQLSISTLRGKVVLLDFWAVWCGPCRAEMPNVKRLWSKYAGSDFAMIGISLDDDRGAFDKYVASEGIKWPQYYPEDGQNIVARLYGVQGIPYTVLIDENGIVRATGLRGSSLDSKIGELLKKRKKS
ncbi:MAG TPA: redoxin domain-containing protein [Blastocatellia bacterium]|nr:redoxin domain-containing protein [Blastocatellia bacterium]